MGAGGFLIRADAGLREAPLLETDVAIEVAGLIARFRPESFDVVAFVSDEAPVSVTVDGYRQRKHMRAQAGGYWVSFQHFYRPEDAPKPAFEVPL